MNGRSRGLGRAQAAEDVRGMRAAPPAGVYGVNRFYCCLKVCELRGGVAIIALEAMGFHDHDEYMAPTNFSKRAMALLISACSRIQRFRRPMIDIGIGEILLR